MVAYLDLNVYQNESFEADISLSKYVSNAQFDASEYEVKAQLKKHYLSKEATDFTTKPVSDGRTGIFNISLTPEQTALLKYGKYVYDVFIKDKSRNVGRYSSQFLGTPDSYIDIERNTSTPVSLDISDNTFVFGTYLYANNSNFEIINFDSGLNISVENSILTIKNDVDTIVQFTDKQIPTNEWVKIRIDRIKNTTNETYKFEYNDVVLTVLNSPTTVFGLSANNTFATMGKNLDGYLSNTILINGYSYKFYFPLLNLGMEGTMILTNRNYTFKDYSKNNLKIIPRNVETVYFSPWKTDTVIYKLIEGALFVNPSASKF